MSAGLGAILVVLALALSGCAAVPDTFACAHCACNTATRSWSRPMLCSTVGRDAQCCTVYFEF